MTCVGVFKEHNKINSNCTSMWGCECIGCCVQSKWNICGRSPYSLLDMITPPTCDPTSWTWNQPHNYRKGMSLRGGVNVLYNRVILRRLPQRVEYKQILELQCIPYGIGYLCCVRTFEINLRVGEFTSYTHPHHTLPSLEFDQVLSVIWKITCKTSWELWGWLLAHRALETSFESRVKLLEGLDLLLPSQKTLRDLEQGLPHGTHHWIMDRPL